MGQISVYKTDLTGNQAYKNTSVVISCSIVELWNIRCMRQIFYLCNIL